MNNRYYNSFPSISSDTRKVIYLSARMTSNKNGVPARTDPSSLYMADLQSGKEEKIPVSGRIKFPSFSPDGTKIVYSCWKEGESVSSIFYFDLASRKEMPVTGGVFESTFPSFSPDSQKVLYSSWRERLKGGDSEMEGFSSIVLVDLKTMREEVLTLSCTDNLYAGFSPNGRNMVYLSRRRDTNKDGKINSFDNANICIYQFRNKKDFVLMSDRFYNKFPSYSHDGKKIVFLSSFKKGDVITAAKDDYFSRKGVYTVDVASRAVKTIANEKYYGCKFLEASPVDSKVGYLAWRENSNRGIYLADYEVLPDVDELRKLIKTNLQKASDLI